MKFVLNSFFQIYTEFKANRNAYGFVQCVESLNRYLNLTRNVVLVNHMRKFINLTNLSMNRFYVLNLFQWYAYI